MKLFAINILLCFLLTNLACQHAPFEEMEPVGPAAILTFIGHPRMDMTGDVNPQLMSRDWKEQGTLLLGGDLDKETSRNDMVMMAYDEILDFSNPSTLLTIGNHDQTNIPLLLEYTNRDRYFVHQTNQVCIFVGDTQLNKGNFINDQLNLFRGVTDTLSHPRTFILLTHKLIWVPGHPELAAQIDNLPNGGSGNCEFCTSENNFYDVIYPRLVELVEEGFQVICLAGDLGSKQKHFEFVTEEGIQYLANGWNRDDPDNTFLEFYLNDEQQLDWAQIGVE